MTTHSVADTQAVKIGYAALSELKKTQEEGGKDKTSLEISHTDRFEKSGVKNPAGLYEKISLQKTSEQNISGQNSSLPQTEFQEDKENISAASEEENTKMSKCTVNTDQVDREIERLNEEKQKLQQQLQKASNDPKKKEDLQQKLQSLETELQIKDNDSYRKQHAVVTYS